MHEPPPAALPMSHCLTAWPECVPPTAASEAIGVNQDVVVIPPVDEYDPGALAVDGSVVGGSARQGWSGLMCPSCCVTAGSPPVYTCSAYNRGYVPISVSSHVETCWLKPATAMFKLHVAGCCRSHALGWAG